MAETGAHLTNKRFARRSAQEAELGTPLVELSLGPAEEVTIVSGVATITRSCARLTSETSTTDTLDSIAKANVADGDVVILHVTAGHTITCSKAGNLAIGAATRAVAPGGSITFVYNGASAWWQELSFLTAADST